MTMRHPDAPMLHAHEITPADYDRFKRFLENACGILLGDGKQYLVSSRLNKLLREEGLDGMTQLLGCLERDQPRHLRDAVIDAMTTNETSWFRDGTPFEILSGVVLPELEGRAGTVPRIWSAACSSGQEPYTISITVGEYLQKRPGSRLGATQIVATDISASVLAQARRGTYESVALGRGLSETRRRQWFTQDGDSWQVNEAVRRRVSFREQNLLHGFSALGRFDIIFCRNVLIYFAAERKRDILQRMALSLNPQGYLFLGASETISGYSDAFELVRSPSGNVYRKR